MKKRSNLLMSVAFLCLIFSSCEKDDTIKKETNQFQGKIAFNLKVESNELKSSQTEDFLSLSTAIISIETANGDSSIMDFAQLKIFRIGTALFTEEIALPNNDYVLTHFFLQDSTGNTLYVCPQKGSQQAQNVKRPAPIEFTVLPGVTTPVSIEVLSTKNHTPEDFGLSYFEVDFVETIPLLISAVDAQNFSPLRAQVEIEADNSYSFVTTIDSLRFNIVQIKDGFEFYSFTVSKEGYESSTAILPLSLLKTYIDSPLTFVLEPKDSTLHSNIILDYQLDRNALDDGINGYHLSGYNTEYCLDRFGKDSMAFEFYGKGGLTLYNKSIINQSDQQTLTAWFKTNNLNQEPLFGGFIATMIGSEGAGEGSRFSINMKNGYVRANYGDGYSESDQKWHDQLISPNTYNDGNWHFVAFVSDGDFGTLSLYIDGELIVQQISTRSNNNQIDGLDIKIGGDTYASYFTGSIDEVLLYNKALSETEIKNLYTKK